MSNSRRSSFPRGLVLGLTMAETAILIIFVLLLALAVLLAREADRRQAAEQDLERFSEIKRILLETDLDAAGVLALMEARTAAHRDADNWRELVRDLGNQIPDPSPEAIVSRVDEAREALERDAANKIFNELLDQAGLKPTPETHSDLARILTAAREAGLGLDDVRQAIGELQAGGGGSDHPSCWYDADSTEAYLFDVALTNDGFVLETAPAPQHKESRALLPLDRVETGRTLTVDEFLAHTRPVYEWSVQNGCRFFVRAFDLTGANKKELYKTRMRTLESRFYKNASPSGPPPFADQPSQSP